MREQEGLSRQSESEYYTAFLERLQRLTPVFLEMRAKMGVGDHIGLGTLGEAQRVVGETYSGAVLPFEYDEATQERFYGHPEFSQILGIVFHRKKNVRDLTGAICVDPVVDPELPHIYFPDYPARGGLVIVYDASGQQTMTDEQIIGTMAHELAEVRVRTVNVPEDMRDVLAEKARHKDLSYPGEFHDRNDESDYDVVAARFGYKKPVLAQLQNALAHYRNMRNKYADNRFVLEQLDQMTTEVEFRIAQVLTYS